MTSSGDRNWYLLDKHVAAIKISFTKTVKSRQMTFVGASKPVFDPNFRFLFDFVSKRKKKNSSESHTTSFHYLTPRRQWWWWIIIFVYRKVKVVLKCGKRRCIELTVLLWLIFHNEKKLSFLSFKSNWLWAARERCRSWTL